MNIDIQKTKWYVDSNVIMIVEPVRAFTEVGTGKFRSFSGFSYVETNVPAVFSGNMNPSLARAAFDHCIKLRLFEKVSNGLYKVTTRGAKVGEFGAILIVNNAMSQDNAMRYTDIQAEVTRTAGSSNVLKPADVASVAEFCLKHDLVGIVA